MPARVFKFCILSIALIFLFFPAATQAQTHDTSPAIHSSEVNQMNNQKPGKAKKPDFYIGIHAPQEESDTVKEHPPSLLETTFSNRGEQDLKMFGYDLFKGKAPNIDVPMGMVQDSYILGPGDKLQVTFRGQRDDSRVYQISPQGLLTVDGFPPVNASGMSMADFKLTMERLTKESLINSMVYTSLKEVRQVGVMVLGEVHNPGQHTLSSFHTLVDALYKAGGVKKTGSLRQIKLVRGTDKHIIDLYQLVLEGKLSANLRLRDGDRLVVPLLGSTVAVAGDVKRPAIFETPKNREGYRFDDLLTLSGGILKPGANRYVRISLNPDGTEFVEPVTPENPVTFYDGDILLVQAAKESRVGSVALYGHVSEPGTHSIRKRPSLSSLLPDYKAVKKEAYPLFGLIRRFDTDTISEKYIPFSPKHVIDGLYDEQLTNDDKVYVFSAREIRNLEDRAAQGEQKTIDRFQEISPDIGSKTEDGKDKERNNEKSKKIKENYSYEQLLNDKVVRDIILESAVRVRGAVQHQGLYPVAKHASIAEIIAVAGGVSNHADLDKVHVTFAHGPRQGQRILLNLNRPGEESLSLTAQDTLVINETFTPVETVGVTIKGEVRYPGTYDLKKGDTIMDLIRRAGGLTDFAYADGAIFTRVSARKREEEQYRRVAQELNRRMAMALTDASDHEKSEKHVVLLQELLSDLEQVNALGRITVEASPAELMQNPEKAILLEKGDLVYFPKKPYTVAVRGEVHAPAELAFDPDHSARDYVMAAGGTTRLADDNKAFVVLPDGSSRPVSLGSWSSSGEIPPGSTVIVPRDPEPFDTIAFTGNILGILSNLAITGLAIDDITDN